MKKVFYSIQVQQLQSSSTESVFVYMCTCVFVYLFEKIFLNSTQVQQLQSTGRMWRHLSKLLHLLHSIHNQFCLISFCLCVISSHINIFTNIHTNIFTNIHTNIFTNIHTNIFTNIQTNIEGEARRIYCIHCSLNSGRVASSFLVEQFHSTRDFCLN